MRTDWEGTRGRPPLVTATTSPRAAAGSKSNLEYILTFVQSVLVEVWFVESVVIWSVGFESSWCLMKMMGGDEKKDRSIKRNSKE